MAVHTPDPTLSVIDVTLPETSCAIDPAVGAVTDADVKADFEAHKSAWTAPERRRVAHILVKTRAEALEIKKKLDAGASLVQVYTGLIYRGPFFAAELARALGERQRR